MGLVEVLEGTNYIWKIADNCEEAIRFALPPSVVMKVGNQCHAFWLLADAPPEPKRYAFTAGGRRHVLRWRPDIRYKYRDYVAAGQLPEEVLLRILAQSDKRRTVRTERELFVIGELRKAGVSVEAIEIIFKEQPIGDYSRDSGSLIGSLTMVDELVQDVVKHHKEDRFAFYEEKGMLWFNVLSVLRWWYPKRRRDGLRILPEKELYMLLKSQSQETASGMGHYLVYGVKAYKKTVWHMYGIDLEEARRVGVIDAQ